MSKAIIFDLGGVLINLNMSAVHQQLGRLGVRPDLLFVPTASTDTSTVCNGLSVSSLIADYQVGLMTTVQFVDVILPHCVPGTTRQVVIDAWNSCLLDLPLARLDLIKSLRQQGHRTYLLSNTNDLHWQFIVEHHFSRPGYTVADLFDAHFLSHEMHLAKPHDDIYRAVLDRLPVPSNECLFIDDSEPNVLAAQRNNIPSLWLDLSSEDVVQMFRRLAI